MKSVFRFLVLSLIGLIVAATMLYFVDDALFQSIFVEDGLVENLTAVVLLVFSILMFRKAWIFRKEKAKKWVFLQVFLALGLFFGFGEEISWGQRLLGVESPEFFTENNLQNETNLHNLKIKGVKLNKVIFTYGLVAIFGTYFLGFLPAYRKWNTFQRLIDSWGIPIPTLQQIVVLIGCTVAILIIPDQKKWEAWEGLFVLLLFYVFLDPYNDKENLLGTFE